VTKFLEPALEKLRAVDAETFSTLIDLCSPMMLRLARGIAGEAVAEEEMLAISK